MIRIRAASADDAAQMAGIYGPHVAAGIASFEAEPPGADEMARRLAEGAKHYPWLVATGEEERLLLGYAYATAFRAREAYRFAVETTIYVAGDLQRQGVGRLLYEALLDTLRAQEFTQAVASVTLPNDASIALHESVGFRRAGVYREIGWKGGQWRDVGIWQASLAEPDNPPAEPRAFSEVGLVREP